MGGLKTLAILGGAGLLVNELSKSKDGQRSANTTATAKPVIDNQKVKEEILKDPVALSMLRGEKGDPGNGYKATIATSTNIALELKTFTLATANLAYTVGARVRVTASTDVTKFMEGIITAVTATTIVVAVDTAEGTGTFATWNLNLTGGRGAAGTHGASGDSAQNYGASLIKNGALEDNNLGRWTGTGLAIGADNEGMPTLEGTAGNNTSYIWLRTDKLYKAEYLIKGTGNHSMLVNLYKRDNSAAPKTDNSAGAYFKFNSAMPANFTKVIGYIGGVGTNNINLSANTVKAKVSFIGHNGALISLSKLVVTEVSLGEPVPYNLPYLPTFQTVYDPTTGKLGMFNGTAVVWTT